MVLKSQGEDPTPWKHCSRSWQKQKSQGTYGQKVELLEFGKILFQKS